MGHTSARGKLMRSGYVSNAALLLVLALTGGCTKFASEWDESTDSAHGALRVIPGDYSCVATEARSTPITAVDPPPLVYSVQAVDFISGLTPPSLRIRACYRTDIQCLAPVTPSLAPDATGVVTLPLTLDFSGYLELTGDGVVPTLYFFPDLLTPDLIERLEQVPLALLSPESLAGFGGTSRLALDPGTGIISMNTFDCSGPNAAGVRLELDSKAVPFAFVDGLPVPYQDTTTEEGAAGFANVPPGLAVVKGFKGESTEVVALETVVVRAQWVTIGALMPQFAQ
jgi:hypothetical protein